MEASKRGKNQASMGTCKLFWRLKKYETPIKAIRNSSTSTIIEDVK